MKEKLGKVVNIFVSVLLWAVILLAALYTFTTLATKGNGQVSRFLGFTPMTVLTESMEPTFSSGDLIIIKECDTSKLEVGDIVTFNAIIDNEYALNTHRIVEIQELDGMRAFTTKGDNNLMEDPSTIASGDIVGQYVLHIPYLGKVMAFLSSKIGFLVCIVLPMLLFFIYQVYNLVVIGMKLKKEEALEAAEEAAKIAQSAQNNDSSDETERLRAELEEAKRKLAEAEAGKEDK